MKHPKDWEVKKESNGVITIKGKERSQLSIEYRDFYDPSLGRNRTINEVMDKGMIGPNAEKEAVLIDGIEGQKVGYSLGLNYPVFAVVLQKSADKKIYKITFEGFDAKLQTFNQILSTFRFTK